MPQFTHLSAGKSTLHDYANIYVFTYIYACDTLPLTATCVTRCNSLQHTAMHSQMKTKGSSKVEMDTLPMHSMLADVRAIRAATHCNRVQHTATHCNTLRHTATHCTALQHTAKRCVPPWRWIHYHCIRCLQT